MVKERQKINISEYLLVFLLLFVSGNPAAKILDPFQYLLVVILELVVWGRTITAEGWRNAGKWTAVLIVIFIGQLITLGTIGYAASANYIFKMLTAIFAAAILKDKFPLAYLKVMAFLSVIALVFWAINLAGIHLPSLMTFENDSESLLVYTQSLNRNLGRVGILRNWGMFWEPGAYSGYIIFAFLLFINRLDYLWREQRKEWIILLVALLTTFSTTGYILLALVLFFSYSDRIKNRVAFYFIGIIVVFFAVWLFGALDFMGDKIEEEYMAATEMGQYDVSFSRFGSIAFDSQYIMLHPIFGNGLIDETRYSMHILFAENLHAFGNGFTGEIAIFGIPFMLLFLFSTYRNPTLNNKWRFLLLLILQLQGEQFMNYPLFLIFPFVWFFQESYKPASVVNH